MKQPKIPRPTIRRKPKPGLKSRPNILLIVLDTLRADRLACYGYERATSPHIDAFAAQGTLFERAIAPAQWTIPSHASFFTGEYPTTHRTVQIYDKHSPHYPTVAELLQKSGYHTLGISNNPYLGVIENDLDRGFEQFYNYSGLFPERPDIGETRPSVLGRLMQRVGRTLNRLNGPIQHALTHNNLLLRIALHPRIVPLWNRHMNTKGRNRQSLRDFEGYLNTWESKERERPIFAFINLMETHLPYGPPPRFIRRFAPYYSQSPEARQFMQAYNLEPYQWMVPLAEPLTELQHRVLNDMYDAEIAYEDQLLGGLFEYLDQPRVRENTLVILTSDHGEGMGYHDFVGHSLVAYDDLLHVPLIIRYPGRFPADHREKTFVSLRRIFHTILEAAGVEPETLLPADEHPPFEVAKLSLARTVEGRDPENGLLLAEAYTPDTLVKVMEMEEPENIDRFRCREMRRAAYRDHHKLISVGGEPDELFDLAADPGELHNHITAHPDIAEELARQIEALVAGAEQRHHHNGNGGQIDLEDSEVAERLRKLGYLA